MPIRTIPVVAAFALAIGAPAVAVAKAKLTVLYSFKGGADGATPYATLVRDTKGNLYGTTLAGGSANLGTVFVIRKSGIEKVLHSFTGGNDGASPYSGLAADSQGMLYGVTYHGGSPGLGTVYKITTAGAETVLHVFQGIYGNNDGSFPYGSPVIATDGLLYGTTVNGGSPSDEGSLYVFTPIGGFGGVLHAFRSMTGDATHPYSNVTNAQIKNTLWLFGTGAFGGSNNFGAVFGFYNAPPWDYIIYPSFSGGNGGQRPMSSPVFDAQENCWGTATGGGSFGLGTIYTTDDDNDPITTTYSFKGIYNASDGSFPYAALIIGADGNLYGTTLKGGNSSDSGTIYSFNSTSSTETPLYRFSGPDGSHPYGALIEGAPGTFYGTTSSGGENNLGVVYKLVVK